MLTYHCLTRPNNYIRNIKPKNLGALTDKAEKYRARARERKNKIIFDLYRIFGY